MMSRFVSITRVVVYGLSRVLTGFSRTSAIVALVAVVGVACGRAQAPAAASQPPSEQQEEFVPIDQLPPQEQMPAGPLLVGAYVFVVGVLFVYVLSVARRLATVQRELERVEADVKRSGRT